MKHLNANLDNITSLELKETPVGVIRAVGVDSDPRTDGDLVAIPGVEYGTNGPTFIQECEFVQATAVTTNTPLDGSAPTTVVTFTSTLENLTTTGGVIEFYAGGDLDLANKMVEAGAMAVATVTVVVITANTVTVMPQSGTAAELTDLLLATATTQVDGSAQGVYFTDCQEVALTVDGPVGGNLCVTGNLLLGGSLTDKDGNDIIIIGDDGEVEVDGDLDVDGDITGRRQ